MASDGGEATDDGRCTRWWRIQRVQTLQCEVDAAHRALQVQNKYENNVHASSASLPLSLGANRELLRSLFFDLGKAAADNHALSLALANAEQAQQALTASLSTARGANEALTAHLEELEFVVSAKECLQEQVADLAAQLATRSSYRHHKNQTLAADFDREHLFTENALWSMI
eukprot:gene8329-6009_t